jgi:cell fate (sporulation/competence/biofilm development) regulator YlbF (YheA/YmcA/DUF963 family)
MEVLSPNSAILDKTRELCSLILHSGEYKENAARIDTFFNDKAAQASYRQFTQLGESLHQKQSAGELTEDDIEGYDAELAALKANPVTGEFMAAEESLNGIVQQVSRMVGKALELGRLPEPEDLAGGGCCGGGGCGC